MLDDVSPKFAEVFIILFTKWLFYFKDMRKKHGNIRRRKRSNNDGNFEGEK